MTRLVSILLLVTACSPGVADRPVHCDDTGRCDLPDAELGKRALQLLGADVEGATARCRECHSLSRDGLRNWLELTRQAREGCLKDGISAADAVACFRQDGAPADAMYPPKKLGIYAAGAH